MSLENNHVPGWVEADELEGNETQVTVEFRASGDMAFTTLQVAYEVGDGSASRSVMSTDVMALRRDELGVWTIVSHLSRLEGAAVAAGAASADSIAQ